MYIVERGSPVAKFIVPDWGDKVDSGIGLSYWPVTMIKNQRKFSSYMRKVSGDYLQSHIRKSFLIYEKMRKYLVINEEAVSHK